MRSGCTSCEDTIGVADVDMLDQVFPSFERNSSGPCDIESKIVATCKHFAPSITMPGEYDGRFCLERDIDQCIVDIKAGKLLPEHTIKFICSRLINVFAAESNVAAVSAPVSVVGDLHGQFFDLLELFQVGGDCPHTNYLFLGDYVDRGSHSVEVISLLCCLKLRYPQRITLLRGNHESRQTTQVYGFYSDCQKKYGSVNVWTYFTDMFDYIPIAALIDGRIFCVHAGSLFFHCIATHWLFIRF
jgi:serine/threonine-protein phosphatase PPG1